MERLKNCLLCPRNCHVNRLNGQVGFCKASNKVKIARAALHEWEEPCISGINGSGTIFFSNCNLKCVYCQNYNISTNNIGIEISIKELSKIFLKLQKEGAHNINLVTPTHYIPQIILALKKAKQEGLTVPIVYNTSGYEKVDTIKLLDGLIDIYLPDMKYFDNNLAYKYSKAPNYFKYCSEAIEEMVRQVGSPKFNKNNILVKGVIVRHLMLPTHFNDSKKIINYLYSKYKDNIYISIMNQYTPLEQVQNILELNQTITEEDYDNLINYALDLGIKNAYIQEGETQKTSFIPSFNIDDVKKQLQ